MKFAEEKTSFNPRLGLVKKRPSTNTIEIKPL